VQDGVPQLLFRAPAVGDVEHDGARAQAAVAGRPGIGVPVEEAAAPEELELRGLSGPRAMVRVHRGDVAEAEHLVSARPT
jgi:hypothetical protein